ncbi:thioesterase family protein [Salinisphaera aquimarina]|uniref:Thioesterase family protein n=1 Tax=Salinisphaera aquimarina TaxID=2094031 RepID=A0ABV7ETS8_9GAMM
MTDTDTRMPLSDLLSSMTPIDGGARVHITPDWLQGRAVYGGLSVALSLQATQNVIGDGLPPLRSVQTSFIGPATSEVDIYPQVVRQGKSTAFVTVDMYSDDKLAARTTFCFGKARESRLAIANHDAPAVPSVDACGAFFEGRDGRNAGPNFAQHFNSRLADGGLPVAAAEQPEFTVWLQHKDPASRESLVGLTALADALPPAAMACFGERAPISTMTWMFDVLQAAPSTVDGWWLCRSSAEYTEDGYSAQAMTIWNTVGELVVIGRQNIAIFY